MIAFSNNGGLANLNHKLSFEVEKSSLIRLDLYGEDIADSEKVYPDMYLQEYLSSMDLYQLKFN